MNDPPPDRTWDAFEKAILVCDPIGVATDRLQADAATPVLVLHEMQEIRERFIALAKEPGIKTAAEVALKLFNKRAGKMFNYDMLHCFRFLDPAVDQRTAYSDEERTTAMAKLMVYAKPYFERRGEDFNEQNFATQVGRFVVRPEAERNFAGDKLEFYNAYWSSKAVSWIALARFALPLGDAAISEAAVERSFSAQARIFSDLRARMTESSCEAQMWIAMNCMKVMNPREADKEAAKRVETQKQKRRAQQAVLDEIVVKRRRQ
jgi:hypothetical protein